MADIIMIIHISCLTTNKKSDAFCHYVSFIVNTGKQAFSDLVKKYGHIHIGYGNRITHYSYVILFKTFSNKQREVSSLYILRADYLSK